MAHSSHQWEISYTTTECLILLRKLERWDATERYNFGNMFRHNIKPWRTARQAGKTTSYINVTHCMDAQKNLQLVGIQTNKHQCSMTSNLKTMIIFRATYTTAVNKVNVANLSTDVQTTRYLCRQKWHCELKKYHKLLQAGSQKQLKLIMAGHPHYNETILIHKQNDSYCGFLWTTSLGLRTDLKKLAPFRNGQLTPPNFPRDVMQTRA